MKDGELMSERGREDESMRERRRKDFFKGGVKGIFLEC